VSVVADVSVDETIVACRESGFTLVTADAHAHRSLDAAAALLRQPVAWIFGSEAHGVREEWRAAVTDAVRIPMAGQAESLNLAAAAAICLYATQRARTDAQDQGPAGAVGP
jgi:TrmH family RNA methyltransferase